MFKNNKFRKFIIKIILFLYDNFITKVKKYKYNNNVLKIFIKLKIV